MTVLIPPKQRRENRKSSSYQRQLEQQLLARFMLLAGFVTQVVSIETGLTQKRVRAIRKDLLDNRYSVAPTRRTLRTSKTIVVGQAGKLHASLFMSLYSNMGAIANRDGATPPVQQSINIDSLLRAYGLYTVILQELPPSSLISWKNALEISDAWALAAELRSGIATIWECRTCKNKYFESSTQDTLIDCPYCKELAQSSLKLFDEQTSEQVA